jgi:hypothetical protein
MCLKILLISRKLVYLAFLDKFQVEYFLKFKRGVTSKMGKNGTAHISKLDDQTH